MDPRLSEIQQQIGELNRRKASLEGSWREILCELVNKALGRQDLKPHQIDEGSWVCPDPEDKDPKEAPSGRFIDGHWIPADMLEPQSPTGRCVYIPAEEDDICVFCGNPEERK